MEQFLTRWLNHHCESYGKKYVRFSTESQIIFSAGFTPNSDWEEELGDAVVVTSKRVADSFAADAVAGNTTALGLCLSLGRAGMDPGWTWDGPGVLQGGPRMDLGSAGWTRDGSEFCRMDLGWIWGSAGWTPDGSRFCRMEGAGTGSGKAAPRGGAAQRYPDTALRHFGQATLVLLGEGAALPSGPAGIWGSLPVRC